MIGAGLSIAGNVFGGLLAGLVSAQSGTAAFASSLTLAQQTLTKSSKAVANSFMQVVNAAESRGNVGGAVGGAFEILASTIGLMLTPALVIAAAAFLTL